MKQFFSSISGINGIGAFKGNVFEYHHKQNHFEKRQIEAEYLFA